jgi:NAD(P)-dependent dehydrogenase (short-subunit alcohol dehydrogenase family)
MNVALVTGGAGGIGRAVSAELARGGAAVAVHYNRDREGAEALAAQLPRAVALQADLGAREAPEELVRAATRLLGPVTILVNNAGVMTGAPVEELSDSLWSETLELNLTAAFRACRAAIPGMRAAAFGRIVNISSQSALRGSARHAHYAAAKAGLHGFTYSLARELGPTGITVNLVVPGRIETPLLEGRSAAREREWLAQTPVGRLGSPEEVAAVVGFLASPQASYVTGAAFGVTGGLTMG